MNWEKICSIKSGKSTVVPALWAELPKLEVKSKVKILDAAGPGVVTCLHVSRFCDWADTNTAIGETVIIRIFYDNKKVPSVEMPLMDFLGDIQAKSSYFNTIYFTKVKESHNFRLPIPFRKHITIELENPTDKLLAGYTDIQYERVKSIPADCGYLMTEYRAGNLDSKKPYVFFNCNRPGTIVAHWLQYESVDSIPAPGDIICEADQQIFLDGDKKPTLNYLGTEDVYGYSWGYKAVHSDNYCAILKLEELSPAGGRVAVLRCRDMDSIRFNKSCRWLITWENDQWTIPQLTHEIPFRHCVYYYAK